MDNIRINLQEVGCGYMDWIGLAQVRDKWRTLAVPTLLYQRTLEDEIYFGSQFRLDAGGLDM